MKIDIFRMTIRSGGSYMVYVRRLDSPSNYYEKYEKMGLDTDHVLFELIHENIDTNDLYNQFSVELCIEQDNFYIL